MELINNTCPNCGAPIPTKKNASSVECEYCGSVFHVSKPEVPQSEQRHIETPVTPTATDTGTTTMDPRRNTWLWVLGWLLCWPVTLTVLMLNSKTTANLDPKIRWGVVIAVWLILFLAAAAG